ncbi:hypothetical protein TPY_2770 [Sulfobacillus acidophilus TPY]|uniref:Uncharacterized protein n=1 Tax=Sulfobacillus acidophilus (strain ATCC 700253 / DSM 10332 / NAL) TaxID=679936 RepID=G8TU19_SULAD|nr:hypothetical protein TPY_2770 [Sulfobacillus acidophilus TPY]AEW04610.1 hypothetical protein Sulac_1110 [Sulfobacillus acidophilus DSM 10332]
MAHRSDASKKGANRLTPRRRSRWAWIGDIVVTLFILAGMAAWLLLAVLFHGPTP